MKEKEKLRNGRTLVGTFLVLRVYICLLIITKLFSCLHSLWIGFPFSSPFLCFSSIPSFQSFPFFVLFFFLFLLVPSPSPPSPPPFIMLSKLNKAPLQQVRFHSFSVLFSLSFLPFPSPFPLLSSLLLSALLIPPRAVLLIPVITYLIVLLSLHSLYFSPFLCGPSFLRSFSSCTALSPLPFLSFLSFLSLSPFPFLSRSTASSSSPFTNLSSVPLPLVLLSFPLPFQVFRRFATAAARPSASSPSIIAPPSPTTPVYTPSLWDSLPFYKSSMPRVPLNEAFPSLPKVNETQSQAGGNEEATITTLPNGLRVCTMPGSASPVSSIGVFIDAGSRYETAELNGITHFLELMSLKSTSNRSDFRLVREMLKMGANISASSSRESFIYSADCLNEYVPAIVGTLADVIQNHEFHIEELLEEKEWYEREWEEREKLMDVKMMEAIHEAAYSSQTLGLPLYPPKQNLPAFTADTLKAYMNQFFTPKRMVISAVGVDHNDFVKLVSEAFTKLPADVQESSNKPPAVYTGGEIRIHSRSLDSPLTHLASAFETANWHHKDLVPMCVLQMLMGGGGSFSAGGPGKGMYSRLYNNILNKYDWAESATSFNSIFSDSSLFGIYATCFPDKSKNLIDTISKEAMNMAGPVKAEELARAKAQLKSAVYMQLESRQLKLEDIGRQVAIYGRIQSPKQITALIDGVQAEDIQRVAKNMLSSPLSIAAMGDLSYLPRYDQIQRNFK